MSKKSSKINFRDYFPKRGVPVAPAPDEETGSSQESMQQRTHAIRDYFETTNENKIRGPSSKTSLPNTFGQEERKNRVNHIFQFGSETVRSVVTPPRSSGTSKVDVQRQGAYASINNDNNNNDEETDADEKAPAKVSASKDSSTEYCRICHDNPSKLVLSSPCLCKGTMGMVHLSCLEHWLGESGKNHCEICGYEYVTQRQPKYSGCSSIFHWLRHPQSPGDTRNFVFDLACFCILTPLAGVSAWLCVLGAQHYTFEQEPRRPNSMHNPTDDSAIQKMRFRNHNYNRYADGTNSAWTSVGLLTLTGTLIAAYFVWVVVAFKFHLQVYRDWKTRNYIVTIVPMSPQDHAIAQEVRDRDVALGRSYRSRNRNNASAANGNSDNNNNTAGLTALEILELRDRAHQRRMELEFQRPEFIEFQQILHTLALDVVSINANKNLNNNNYEDVQTLVGAVKGKRSCCSVSDSANNNYTGNDKNESIDSVATTCTDTSSDGESRNRNIYIISNRLKHSSSSSTNSGEVSLPLQENDTSPHRTNSSPQ